MVTTRRVSFFCWVLTKLAGGVNSSLMVGAWAKAGQQAAGIKISAMNMLIMYKRFFILGKTEIHLGLSGMPQSIGNGSRILSKSLKSLKGSLSG